MATRIRRDDRNAKPDRLVRARFRAELHEADDLIVSLGDKDGGAVAPQRSAESSRCGPAVNEGGRQHRRVRLEEEEFHNERGQPVSIVVRRGKTDAFTRCRSSWLRRSEPLHLIHAEAKLEPRLYRPSLGGGNNVMGKASIFGEVTCNGGIHRPVCRSFLIMRHSVMGQPDTTLPGSAERRRWEPASRLSTAAVHDGRSEEAYDASATDRRYCVVRRHRPDGHSCNAVVPEERPIPRPPRIEAAMSRGQQLRGSFDMVRTETLDPHHLATLPACRKRRLRRSPSRTVRGR